MQTVEDMKYEIINCKEEVLENFKNFRSITEQREIAWDNFFSQDEIYELNTLYSELSVLDLDNLNKDNYKEIMSKISRLEDLLNILDAYSLKDF